MNDFDIHYFYAQNIRKPRLSRTVVHIRTKVGAFANVPVDFIRTVVPRAAPSRSPHRTVNQLRRFLSHRETSNAAHLATKAVIGLWPISIFEKTIWPVA